MVVRAMLVLALAAPLMACAQEVEDVPVRQLSTTQAHLREAQPPQRTRGVNTPTLLRLLGKVLSSQFDGVRVELDAVPEPGQAALVDPGAVHLNRRAEICFDNYRLGLRRDGVVMRYELAF